MKISRFTVLTCYKEEDNPHDPYAVAVTKHDSKTVVGHVLRKISAACYLFLTRKENSLACKVTGERALSKGLPQGGLQVPCVLTFLGRSEEIRKIVKLLKSSVAVRDPPSPPPTKKAKLEHMCNETIPRMSASSSLLNKTDEKLLLNGEWLNDTNMNLAQQLLSKQFPNFSGLHSTLLLPQAKQVVPACARALQIIHTRGNHWIVASKIGCQPGEVKIFDLLCMSIDLTTMALISTVFGKEITTVHLEES